ncbi:unnamed protein product [Acidithrix sp. C25]|nr:unnamed protein product [Acidithrix sp. C25]
MKWLLGCVAIEDLKTAVGLNLTIDSGSEMSLVDVVLATHELTAD